jgi:hypothetical protein
MAKGFDRQTCFDLVCGDRVDDDLYLFVRILKNGATEPAQEIKP